MVEYTFKCPVCENMGTFYIVDVTPLQKMDYPALKVRHKEVGVRVDEMAIYFWGLSACQKCRRNFIVNFCVGADRFIKAYENYCPEIYDDDEPDVKEFFRRMECPLENFAWPKTINFKTI